VTYLQVREASVAGLALRDAVSDPTAFARVRRRWLEDRVLQPGDVGLDDVEALSVLCGLDEPGAEALLDAFGSLPEVIGAPAADLARVAGRRAAVRLRLVQALARRQLERPLRDRPVISASTGLQAYLRSTLTGAPREQFRAIIVMALQDFDEATGDAISQLDAQTLRSSFERLFKDLGDLARARAGLAESWLQAQPKPPIDDGRGDT